MRSRAVETFFVCICAGFLAVTCLDSRESTGVGVRRRTGLQLKTIGNHTWRRRGGSTTAMVPATRGPTVATRREPGPGKTANNRNLTVAILLPHTNFGVREYNKVINEAVKALHKNRPQRFQFLQTHHLAVENVKMKMMKLTPSPTGKVTRIVEPENSW